MEQSREYHFSPLKPDQTVTTSFHPFDVTPTPSAGPPGSVESMQTLVCPVCGAEMKHRCLQQTVLFVKALDLRTEGGRVLKQALWNLIWHQEDKIGLACVFALIAFLPSVLLAGALTFPALLPLLGPKLRYLVYGLVWAPCMLLFTVLLFVLRRGYQYLVFSMRDSLVSIGTPEALRPEFGKVFNIFSQVPSIGSRVPFASQHFTICPTSDRDLLTLYGFMPCNLFLAQHIRRRAPVLSE